MAEEHQYYTLDNGLTVVLIHNPNEPVAAAKVYVKAGSIYETSLQGTGASHYLEHLVAGGSTSLRSEDDYKTAIAKLGGAFNAYTTTDHTCYYINTTTEHTMDATQLLYEWMFYNTFEDKEFNRERQVIQKEIEKNDASIPRQFYTLCQHNFYPTHPLRYPVIGYLENFNALTKQDLQTYYKTFYTPSNMVLVVGGNLNMPQLKNHIQKTFGSIPYSAKPIPETFNQPYPFETRTSTSQTKTAVTLMSIRFSTIDLFNKDLYALDLLEYILGNGETSLLHESLVDEKKLAYSVNCSSYTPLETTGFFDITVELDEKNIERVQSDIFNHLNSLKTTTVNAKRVNRAKKQKLAEEILSQVSIEDKASKLGQSFLYGQTATFFDTYVSNFKEVNSENLKNAAENYFIKEKAIITILSPENENSQSTPNQPKPIKEETTQYKLDNGLRVLIRPQSNENKTFMQVISLGGLRSENTKNNGINSLMTELIGKESQQYPKKILQSIFEDNGAQLSGTVGNNTVFYSLLCLSEDFETLLPYFTDSILHPIFSDSEIIEAKRKQKKWIDQRGDDWFTAAHYQFKKQFFNTHPYGLSKTGEKQSISDIKANDLIKWHQQSLTPKTTIISISGPIDAETTIKTLNKTFGQLPSIKKSFKTPKRKNHKKKTTSNLSIQQDVAALFIGYDATTFKDKDFSLKIDLVDAVLSGMNYPGGRLHNLLREKGLVYMVHATNQSGLEDGVFKIYALTSKESVKEVESIIFDQINDLKKNKISQEEFDLAIAQMKYYYQDKISTTPALSLISSVDELYGLGYKDHQETLKQIDTLTIKDVQKTAKHLFQNEQVFIFTQD